MQHFEELICGKTYHIYNRGINGNDIFMQPDHYTKFLYLYEKYIDPVASTFAWCLLGNHFHLLLRIKDAEEISLKDGPGQTADHLDKKIISRQFGHLFNAYAQSFNCRTKRTGGLFQSPFRRKPVENNEYFTSLIYYIHNNPVKHGFCKRIQEYPWSSYSTIISLRTSDISRDKVIGFFNGEANFIAFHNGKREIINIAHLIFDEP
jgi:REP element-mobilizing transposase RayT